MAAALKKSVVAIVVVAATVGIGVLVVPAVLEFNRRDSIEEYELLVKRHLGKVLGQAENEYVKAAVGPSPHQGEERVLLLHYFVKKEEPNQSFSYSLVNPQTRQELHWSMLRSWNKAEPHRLVLMTYRCRRISSEAFDLTNAKPGDPLRLTLGVGQSLVTNEGGVNSTTLQPDKAKCVIDFLAP